MSASCACVFMWVSFTSKTSWVISWEIDPSDVTSLLTLLLSVYRFDHSPCDPTITLHGPLANSFACAVCYEHFVTQQQYKDHLLSRVRARSGSTCSF